MPRPNRRDAGPPPKRERVNEQIRISPIQLIDEKGHNHGPTDTQRALDMARAAELDLVEVAPAVRPPVCKIMDYGKFRYQKSKKDNESKKKQSQVKIKEIRLSPKTETHDLEVKTDRARRFLIAGDKVQFTVRFKGREIVHKDRGESLLKEVMETLDPVASIEGHMNLQGKNMMLIMAPDKKKVNLYIKELERRREEGEAVPSIDDLRVTDDDHRDDDDEPHDDTDDTDDTDDASRDDSSAAAASEPEPESESEAAEAEAPAEEPAAAEASASARKKKASSSSGTSGKSKKAAKTSSKKSARSKSAK